MPKYDSELCFAEVRRMEGKGEQPVLPIDRGSGSLAGYLVEQLREVRPWSVCEYWLDHSGLASLPRYCNPQHFIPCKALDTAMQIYHFFETFMMFRPTVKVANDILRYIRIEICSDEISRTSCTISAATAPMLSSLTKVLLSRSLSLTDLMVRS